MSDFVTREHAIRTTHLFRCDHMRSVVKIDGKWFHVNNETGEVYPHSECVAGAYRLPVEEPPHYVKYRNFELGVNDS